MAIQPLQQRSHSYSTNWPRQRAPHRGLQFKPHAAPPQLSQQRHAVADHSTAQIPLQVTRNNFLQTLPAIRQALDQCLFYSFDCEMTGLYLQGQEDYSLDDIEDRYIKTAASAEQFLVTQFGLSAFRWTGECYEARTFNIHLFPAPHDDVDRRFMCQASSLLFLASQGFDFNKVSFIAASPLQKPSCIQACCHGKAQGKNMESKAWACLLPSSMRQLQRSLLVWSVQSSGAACTQELLANSLLLELLLFAD